MVDQDNTNELRTFSTRNIIGTFIPWKNTFSPIGLLVLKIDSDINAKKLDYFWEIGNKKFRIRKIYLIRLRIRKHAYLMILYSLKIDLSQLITLPIHTPVIFSIEQRQIGSTIYKSKLKYNNIIPIFRTYLLSSHVKLMKSANVAIYFRKASSGNIYLTVRERNITDSFYHRSKLKLACFFSVLIKNFYRDPPVLLFEKKSEKYEESASILYERLIDRGFNKCKFIITAEGLSKYQIDSRYKKNIIVKGSFTHYLFFFLCKTFISTETPAHAIDLRVAEMFANKKLQKKDFSYIFLQHGVTYMVSLASDSRKAFRKIGGVYPKNTKIIVSSNKEAMHFIQDGFFNPKDIYITGLPKFDRAFLNQDANKIVVMPTWRPWEYNLIKISPNKSEYYNMIETIISAIPIEYISNLIILPHPLFKDTMQLSRLSKYFSTENYENILQNTKLLITDYSSIAYDAFNRGSDVIFWWADKDICMEKYGGSLLLNNDNVFGQVAYDQKTLSLQIRNSFQNSVDREVFIKRFRTIVDDFNKNSTSILVEKLIEDGFIKH